MVVGGRNQSQVEAFQAGSSSDADDEYDEEQDMLIFVYVWNTTLWHSRIYWSW